MRKYVIGLILILAIAAVGVAGAQTVTTFPLQGRYVAAGPGSGVDASAVLLNEPAYVGVLDGSETLRAAALVLDTEVAALDGATFRSHVNGVDPVVGTNLATKNYVDVQDNLQASLSGADFTGIVTGPDPSNGRQLSTKDYVDTSVNSARADATDATTTAGTDTTAEIAAAVAGLARLDGATFTGVTSGLAPTDDENFATKNYVDTHAGSGSVSVVSGAYARILRTGNPLLGLEVSIEGDARWSLVGAARTLGVQAGATLRGSGTGNRITVTLPDNLESGADGNTWQLITSQGRVSTAAVPAVAAVQANTLLSAGSGNGLRITIGGTIDSVEGASGNDWTLSFTDSGQTITTGGFVLSAKNITINLATTTSGNRTYGAVASVFSSLGSLGVVFTTAYEGTTVAGDGILGIPSSRNFTGGVDTVAEIPARARDSLAVFIDQFDEEIQLTAIATDTLSNIRVVLAQAVYAAPGGASASIGNSNVVITGSGSATLESSYFAVEPALNTTTANFAEGVDEEALNAAIDLSARTLTVRYVNSVDSLTNLRTVINQIGARAVLIAGTDGNDSPEATPFSRAFAGGPPGAGSATTGRSDADIQALIHSALSSAVGAMPDIAGRTFSWNATDNTIEIEDATYTVYASYLPATQTPVNGSDSGNNRSIADRLGNGLFTSTTTAQSWPNVVVARPASPLRGPNDNEVIDDIQLFFSTPKALGFPVEVCYITSIGDWPNVQANQCYSASDLLQITGSSTVNGVELVTTQMVSVIDPDDYDVTFVDDRATNGWNLRVWPYTPRSYSIFLADPSLYFNQYFLLRYIAQTRP